jgi:hypothetical protein
MPSVVGRRRLVITLFGVLVAWSMVACGSNRVTDPERATTCAELVGAGRAVAEAVIEQLADRTADGSGAVDPYADVRRLMRTEAFDRRAGELGCGEVDIRRRACTAYRGLATAAEGEAARDFLAPYFAACD